MPRKGHKNSAETKLKKKKAQLEIWKRRRAIEFANNMARVKLMKQEQ